MASMRRLLVISLLAVAVAAAAARAQTAPDFEIVSARLDGGDVRSLGHSDALGAVRGPGRRLFFVARGDDGRGAFWVMNEDGSEPRQLGAKPGGEGSYGPMWSPDGRTVGITRWEGSASVLVLLDAETGAERLVVRARDRGAGWLSWAPGASRFAFASELDSDRAAHALETIGSDGRGRRVIVRLPAGTPGLHGIAWSPRGDRIAYDRGRWLYVVRPQGGASTRLVRGYAPVWSPEGRRLLFRSASGDRIGMVDVATGRTRVLARAAEAWGARWSPDGRRVAFLVRPWNTGVWSVAVVRVSDGRRLHTWQPGREVNSLFFTRNGTRLVYSRATT